MPGVDGTKFPAGLRVLVVDDDRTCLTILEKMLINCDYKVTKCNRAEAALSLLRENKNGFDVVISDVHMPDMDGFKLLVHIGLELDLPVIMMSADARKSVVMKGVIHGACDYLIKPVRIEELRNIWQHVVRKKKYVWEDLEPSANLDDNNRQQKQPGDSSRCEGGECKNKRRRKDKENESEDIDDSFSLKKPRVKWTQELHQQFFEAVSHLGINKATPREISALMNVPGITRQKVASHLQKFRGFLKRLESQQSNGMFMDNIDAGAHGSVSVHSVSMPLVDQTNTFENPKVEYGNQHENQVNFLHDIPTIMEPRRLAAFKHSFMGMRKSRMSGQTHNLALRQPILPISAASQANGFSTLGVSSIQQERNIEATQGFVSSHRLLENSNQNGIHDLGLQGGFNGLQNNYALGRNIAGSGFHIPSLTMAESINYRTSHQHLDHVDGFIREILPQQQEGIEHEENQYAYNWYSMDNPPGIGML